MAITDTTSSQPYVPPNETTQPSISSNDPTPPSISSNDPTQTILNKIQYARQMGIGVRVPFSSLSPQVDPRPIVAALMDGLPLADANKVNALAMGGQGVQLDYRKYPNLVPSQNANSQDSATPPVQSGGIYQDYPKTRFVMNHIVRPVAEVAGQVAGGAAGAAIGTPEAPGIGTTALGLAGATVGGTEADELMNKADTAVGLQHPEDQPGGESINQRLTREGINNGIMVGTGQVIGEGMNVLSPFSNSINSEARNAFQNQNVPSTAAMESNSQALQQLEAVISKLPFVGGRLTDYVNGTYNKMLQVASGIMGKNMSPSIAETIGDNVAEQTSKKINDLAQSGISPQVDPQVVGNSVLNDIQNFTQDKMAQSRAAFNNLKSSVPDGTTIPLPATAQQAQKLAMEQETLPQGLQNPKLVNVLGDLSPNVSTQQVPQMQVSQLMNTRSALGDAAAQEEGAFNTSRPGTKFMGSKAGGAYKSLINSIDEDLGNFSDSTGGDFQAQYQQARQQHGAVTSMMQNPYISRILSTDQPEMISDMAVRPNDTSNLASLQSMLSPQTSEQLGNSFTNNLINKATDADGNFSADKLNSLIKTYGEPTITQAVGEDGFNNLKNLANLSDGSFQDPSFRDFITTLGKRDGDNVSGLILGQRGDQGVANVAKMRSLIGEDSWNEAQDGIVHNLLTNNHGNIDFGGLSQRLSEADPNVLNLALDPNKIDALNDLATMGSAIKKTNPSFLNPSGSAYMMGAFWLLRSAFSNPLNALKVLGGLGTASAAYTTPLAKQWLTDGLVNEGVGNSIGYGTRALEGSVFGNSILNPYKKINKNQ